MDDPMVGMDDPIVVVGGGILGASVACRTAERTDRSVVVLERADALGAGTTAASSLGLRQYGNEVQVRMKREGKRFYNDLLEAYFVPYDATDVVLCATTDDGRESLSGMREAEHPSGSPSEMLDGDDVRAVVTAPGVRTEDVTGALYRANAGFFRDSGAVVEAVASRARAAGATFETGVDVERIVVEDGRAVGVETTDGVRNASAVVAAAGPWNDTFCRTAGVELPVRQQRMCVFDFERGRPFSRPPPKLRHVETGVTFRGRPDGRVLAYHSAPADDKYAASEQFDPDVDAAVGVLEGVQETVRESAEVLLPALADASLVSERVAYPSRTPDGNPVVGWTEVPGLLVAATHSRGVQYAPAIGDIVARQLAGDPTDYYPDVSISRFDGFGDSV